MIRIMISSQITKCHIYFFLALIRFYYLEDCRARTHLTINAETIIKMFILCFLSIKTDIFHKAIFFHLYSVYADQNPGLSERSGPMSHHQHQIHPVLP